MSRIMELLARPGTVLGMLAVAIAAAGLAVAANPSRDGTITACVNKKTKAMRLADSSGRCNRGERKLAWNQRGRPGERGQTGQTGATGERGQTGQTGATGERGADAAATSRDYKPLEHQQGPTAGQFTPADGPSVTVEVPADGAPVVFVSSLDARHTGTDPCSAVADVDDASTGERIFTAGNTGSDTYTRLSASETRFVEGGTHTYHMRYLNTCAGDAYFKERRLALSVLR